MHTPAKFEGRAKKGIGEMIVRSIVVLHGEMGNGFCPNLIYPFLENINIRSCNDGCQKLIPTLQEPMSPFSITLACCAVKHSVTFTLLI